MPMGCFKASFCIWCRSDGIETNCCQELYLQKAEALKATWQILGKNRSWWTNKLPAKRVPTRWWWMTHNTHGFLQDWRLICLNASTGSNPKPNINQWSQENIDKFFEGAIEAGNRGLPELLEQCGGLARDKSWLRVPSCWMGFFKCGVHGVHGILHIRWLNLVKPKCCEENCKFNYPQRPWRSGS